MSNIVKIKKFSIENGKGIRTSIFFSGCTHYCKGCFNQELWDFNVGKPFTREVYENEIKPTINEHIAGISILGGEPFNYRNILALENLIKWFKKDFPEKNIWVWSGFTINELLSEDYDLLLPVSTHIGSYVKKEILPYIDILVDGKFVEEEKDLTLKWCGSRNQRVIDVQKTLEEGKVILYEDYL